MKHATLATRRIALQRLQRGEKVGRISRDMHISPQTLFNWRKLYQQHQQMAARKQPGAPRRFTLAYQERLLLFLHDHPKATYAQMVEVVDHVVSKSVLLNYLRAMHFLRKDRLSINHT